MAIDFDSLPDSSDVLRQMVVDPATQLDAHKRRYQRVQRILEQLPQWRFGQKREKIDERQLFLLALQLEATGGDVKEIIAELAEEQKQDDDQQPPASSGGDKPAKPRGHGRKRLPRTLLRERIEYELSEAERQCPHCSTTLLSGYKSNRLSWLENASKFSWES